MKKFKSRLAATVLIIIFTLSLLSTLGTAYQPAKETSVVHVIKCFAVIAIVYLSYNIVVKIWKEKPKLSNHHKNQYNYGKERAIIKNCSVSEKQNIAPT